MGGINFGGEGINSLLQGEGGMGGGGWMREFVGGGVVGTPHYPPSSREKPALLYHQLPFSPSTALRR